MQKISATIVSSSTFVQTLLNRTAQSVVRWAGINKDLRAASDCRPRLGAMPPAGASPCSATTWPLKFWLP